MEEEVALRAKAVRYVRTMSLYAQKPYVYVRTKSLYAQKPYVYVRIQPYIVRTSRFERISRVRAKAVRLRTH